MNRNQIKYYERVGNMSDDEAKSPIFQSFYTGNNTEKEVHDKCNDILNKIAIELSSIRKSFYDFGVLFSRGNHAPVANYKSKDFIEVSNFIRGVYPWAVRGSIARISVIYKEQSYKIQFCPTADVVSHKLSSEEAEEYKRALPDELKTVTYLDESGGARIGVLIRELTNLIQCGSKQQTLSIYGAYSDNIRENLKMGISGVGENILNGVVWGIWRLFVKRSARKQL